VIASLAADSGSSGFPHAEERFVMRGVPWDLYLQLRDAMDAAGSHVRMTYREGELELMAPSSEHEKRKTLIGRLLEAWCLERGVELFPLGSTTLRSERARRGLEADESYSFGESKESPDLAIEVAISSFRIDKLDVYRGLGIPEIWLFRHAALTIYRLEDGGYVEASASAFVADLDLALLLAHVDTSRSLTAVLRDFRRAIGAA
jgi:Uma2 family endonuclease